MGAGEIQDQITCSPVWLRNLTDRCVLIKTEEK